MFNDVSLPTFENDIRADMSHYSDELATLTLKMLKKKPELRPDATECVELIDQLRFERGVAAASPTGKSKRGTRSASSTSPQPPGAQTRDEGSVQQ